MTLPNGLYCIAIRPVSQGKTAFAAYSKRHAHGTASRHYFCPATRLPPMACVPAYLQGPKANCHPQHAPFGDGLLPLHCRRFGPLARPRRGMGTPAWGLSSCSKLIAIKLCAISEMHAKVRRESVAGYATDETLVCGPKEHTRWWQRYRGHMQGLLYRLILNSYLIQLTYNIWVDRDIIHTNALAGTLLSFGIATLSGLMVKQLSLVF